MTTHDYSVLMKEIEEGIAFHGSALERLMIAKAAIKEIIDLGGAFRPQRQRPSRAGKSAWLPGAKARSKVVDLLGGGPATTREIITKLDAPNRQSVYNALYQLQKAGTVVTKDGVHDLAAPKIEAAA